MRMIDADALKKAMDGYWGRCQRIRKPRNGETAVFLDVKATVEKQPTIDAVPVIRCKDCKYWQLEHYVGGQGMSCQMDNSDDVCLTEPTHFCAWAERKEE